MPNRQIAPQQPGVFETNQTIAPPPGAVRVKFVDLAGAVIAFAWVLPEHADDTMREAAWSFFEGHCEPRPPQTSSSPASPRERPPSPEGRPALSIVPRARVEGPHPARRATSPL